MCSGNMTENFCPVTANNNFINNNEREFVATKQKNIQNHFLYCLPAVFIVSSLFSDNNHR